MNKKKKHRFQKSSFLFERAKNFTQKLFPAMEKSCFSPLEAMWKFRIGKTLRLDLFVSKSSRLLAAIPATDQFQSISDQRFSICSGNADGMVSR